MEIPLRKQANACEGRSDLALQDHLPHALRHRVRRGVRAFQKDSPMVLTTRKSTENPQKTIKIPIKSYKYLIN